MPELPEIETIRNGIEQAVLNKKITAVILRREKLRLPITKNLSKILICQSFTKISRRGKYLLLSTPTGTLIVHLGMSGALRIQPENHQFAKHEHVNIVFANKTALCYHDPRRFGVIIWTTKNPLEHQLLNHLGPEPLEKEFSANYVFTRAQKSKVNIKQFLMNNKNVVGVGNIYANEALFAAKIHPQQKAHTINLDRYRILVNKIKEILRFAIKHGGTSFRDYVDSSGNKGNFQNMLKVYGKENKSCASCQTKLESIRLGGRATVFCPKCQKST